MPPVAKADRLVHMGSVLYLNIPRLLTLTALLDGYIDSGSWQTTSNLHDLGMGLHDVIRRFQPVARRLLDAASPLGASEAVSARSGDLISFDEVFRTKGIPGPDDLTGRDWKPRPGQEPLVYSRRTKPRLLVYIQPRWITFSTAFSRFRDGITTLAGVCQVDSVDVEHDTIHASGLVIALPFREVHLLALGQTPWV